MYFTAFRPSAQPKPLLLVHNVGPNNLPFSQSTAEGILVNGASGSFGANQPLSGSRVFHSSCMIRMPTVNLTCTAIAAGARVIRDSRVAVSMGMRASPVPGNRFVTIVCIGICFITGGTMIMINRTGKTSPFMITVPLLSRLRSVGVCMMMVIVGNGSGKILGFCS